MIDPIEVTARFETDGKITPIRFAWRGRTYLVDSTGRRWQDADGLHILVMVPGDQVIELVFAASNLRWYARQPSRPRPA